jgi:hypothetical protein
LIFYPFFRYSWIFFEVNFQFKRENVLDAELIPRLKHFRLHHVKSLIASKKAILRKIPKNQYFTYKFVFIKESTKINFHNQDYIFMKKLLLFIVCLSAISSFAQTHALKPIGGKIPDESSMKARAIQSAKQKVSIPNLKAVLICGDVDAGGEGNKSYIDWIKTTSKALKDNGVAVKEFYYPNNNWDQIKEAAKGAQFLVYQGHGILLSESPFHVGGFYLKDKIVEPEQIKTDLKLAPNAIVLMSGVCYSAGSSASDDYGDIGVNEAKRRVEQYSAPFLENGCSGYFANNWIGVMAKVVNNLFEGSTLGDAYKSGFISSPIYGKYDENKSLDCWVDKSEAEYSNAFAGNANKTLVQLFGAKNTPAPTPVQTPTSPTPPKTTTTTTTTNTNVEYFTPNLYLLKNKASGQFLNVNESQLDPSIERASVELSGKQGKRNQLWRIHTIAGKTGSFLLSVNCMSACRMLQPNGNQLVADVYDCKTDLRTLTNTYFSIYRANSSENEWIIKVGENQCIKVENGQLKVVSWDKNRIESGTIWTIESM